MRYFYLVQRGTFTRKTDESMMLTGCNGVVNLDYMGSSEFEWGTIPKAFRRIMWDYEAYNIYSTGIKNPNGEELKLFCRNDRAEATIQALKEFIKSPWKLKEYSRLEHVDVNMPWMINFWWCVDIPTEGNLPDWIAFFAPNEELFKSAISSDYNDWWIKMSEEEREKEYKKSLA